MHGRLKVKTTEEQQKAKQEERAKKLKLYNAATSRAFQKRKAGELDTELLEITGQVLQANPDFYTFWNMRKETFLSLHNSMETEELQKLYRGELDFLEMCLKINPKSYGTWHHRCFVMDHMPSPDWKRELELCNLFLQYDERNFHCWDYRRFVVKRSEVPASKEFDFTTSKISSNFSNFSSWHYRSKLLPVLYPDPSQPSGIAQGVLQSEFELVQNGLYTDPDDQSNWFYHKWLLGRGEQKQRINCLHISCAQKRLLVSFTKSIKATCDNCRVLVNQSEVNVRWTNQAGNCLRKETFLCALLIFLDTRHIGELQGADLGLLGQGEGDMQVDILLSDGEGEQVCQHSLVVPSGKEEASYLWSTADVSTWFREALCGVDEEALCRELDTVKELQEVESTNKWAMLTLVLLMRAADPLNYHDQILALLQQLQSLDSPRDSYYQDLRSRVIVESAIATSRDQNSLTLQGQKLTVMCCTELLPLLRELDLSGNALKQARGFSFLQLLRRLNLGANQLTHCQGLNHLPCLTHLDLSDNSISSVDCLLPLQTCRQLKVLNLSGNPVCEDPCACDKLREILPSVEVQLSRDN
ncbi:geranylgeranyl transferase type-2 subunit alpha-like [Babylonia areolata]|uniref:geranylgeranyl transferase type-2 subunit alpha-like n=1 Tax=Babylonia areolata TaxID=304850 RepID=UPI003FD43D0B